MPSGGLPAEWDALPHSARVRKAVEVGRWSLTDATATRLLREWRAGGFTQRLLATFACHGSRDSAALLALTSDPSRTVARVALSVLCDVGDDDSLLTALRALPPRRAAKTLFWLRRPRPKAVDRFVAERAAEGDATAWPLVPLGSTAVLDRYFAVAAERGGDVFWRRLAVLHPARAATEIITRLDALTNPDGLLFADARTVIAVLSGREPDTALAVVAARWRHVPLASIPLQTLATRRTVAVADLVLGATEPVAAHFQRVGHRLDVPRIVGLFRRGAGYLGDPGRWLARLPAVDREAAYRELAPAWTAADGFVSLTVLRRLPALTRQAEARRVAALPVLATRPLQRLPFVGLLPWDEARGESKLWLAHPEAENRAAALVALCEAARFDRARLADLLELLTARKHAQDPVRLAFLGALAALPPGRWKAEHLPGLAQVVRDALDAGDLSGGSVAVLGRLAAQPVPDSKRVLFAATLAKLASAIPDERTAGLSAALAGATDADAPAFARAFTRLHPLRRELASSVVEFAVATRPLGPRLVEVRSEVLAAVEADPALVSLQVRLAAARLAAEPYACWVLGLVGTARWHAATQTAAFEALVGSGQPAEDLERAEAVWAASPDAAARWMALRVLVRVASEQGWGRERCDRLRRYREDPSPAVADEAGLTFPPEPTVPRRA
jgi:hypothetical protein